MKFKDFVKWCNDRAIDGCWDMQTAMDCSKLISEIRKINRWKRNKLWKQKYEKDIVNDIIIPLDKMREILLER